MNDISKRDCTVCHKAKPQSKPEPAVAVPVPVPVPVRVPAVPVPAVSKPKPKPVVSVPVPAVSPLSKSHIKDQQVDVPPAQAHIKDVVRLCQSVSLCISLNMSLHVCIDTHSLNCTMVY